MNELFEKALEYSDKGLIPIPVNYKDKTPIVSWSQYLESRPKKYQLRNWFDRSTVLNMANIIGKGSGICVLDIDDPAKYPEDFPLTPTVKTSRGFHLYFKYPESVEIRNTNLPYGDFKADRTLCNIPPSVHPDGTPYEWVVSLDTPFAELPSWLLDEVRQRIKLQNNFPTPIETPWDEDQETSAYGLPWFAEAEELAHQDKGGRNNLLNTMAAKAGSLIAGGHLNENEARQALEDAARSNGEWSENPREVRATIDSGLSAGKRNPRIPVSKAANDNTPPGEFVIRSYSDIEEEKVDWLWPNVLAKGTTTIIAGYPGVGKSTISLNMAATVTKGGTWPVSQTKAEKGNVILLSIEDIPGAIVKPRLLAAGADVRRIKELTIKDRPFSLATDIPSLRKAVEAVGDVKLIIVDPITAHLGAADNNSVSDVRNITTGLTQLALDFNLAILMVMHLNKSDKAAAIDRLQGSGAWSAAARNIFIVGAHEYDKSKLVMSLAKTNITKPGVSYECRIKEHPNESSYIEWEDATTSVSPEKLLSKKSAVKFEAAKELIEDLLGNGERIPTKTLEKEAADQGISLRTLESARRAMGVLSVRHQRL
jgi:hypothetical protein